MISVKACDLSLGYEGKTVASGLNFELEAGEFLCIFGENGSGKSTLVKAILGMIKPLGGTLKISADCEKPKLGYLSQKSQINDGFPASVYEVVFSGCLEVGKRSPFATREQKRLCLEKMKAMDIADIRKKPFGKLSGGQKQRVLLARALCSARDGLILDEPVTGLDRTVAEEMYDAVAKLKNAGMTVIMVSHDSERAVKLADKVLEINSGSNFFGNVAEYGEYVKGADFDVETPLE